MMRDMAPEISDFLKNNKVATICCVNDNIAPYCFNCFYTFLENSRLLLFKSSENSYHSRLLLKNFKVAGTILPGKLDFFALKGMQFSGNILDDLVAEQIRPDVSYHNAYPFAVAISGHVWCIQLESVKMTDNTRILKNKIEWVRG